MSNLYFTAFIHSVQDKTLTIAGATGTADQRTDFDQRTLISNDSDNPDSVSYSFTEVSSPKTGTLYYYRSGTPEHLFYRDGDSGTFTQLDEEIAGGSDGDVKFNLSQDNNGGIIIVGTVDIDTTELITA